MGNTDSAQVKTITLARRFVDSIYILTDDSSGKSADESTQQLRRYSFVMMEGLMDGFLSSKRSEPLNTIRNAEKFMQEVKWNLCLALENNVVSRQGFYMILNLSREIQQLLESIKEEALGRTNGEKQ